MKEEIGGKFDIGEWVELSDGIGQVIHNRDLHCERYLDKFFEGYKVGEKFRTIIICKVLCDYEGRIVKRNRMQAHNSNYCKLADDRAMSLVDKIKNDKAEEYSEYLLYDDVKEIGFTSRICFELSQDVIDELIEKEGILKGMVGNNFTLSEFIKILKEEVVSVNFKEARKFVVGGNINFKILFFNRMYRVAKKKQIFSRFWFEKY